MPRGWPRVSSWLRARRPWEELTLAVGLTLLAAFPLAMWSSPRQREFNLTYMLPTLGPFVLFLLDRHRKWDWQTLISRAMDGLVLALSVVRVFQYVPYVSGHTLFLSYATITVSSPLARIVAALGLWWSAYYKFTTFSDLKALYGGVLLGVGAGLIYWCVRPRSRRWWRLSPGA